MVDIIHDELEMNILQLSYLTELPNEKLYSNITNAEKSKINTEMASHFIVRSTSHVTRDEPEREIFFFLLPMQTLL